MLVVDDEPEVLSSVRDLLRLDYRVITCGDGGSALEVLRSAEDVHVILSDQRMPGMTGVEVLRQAKAIRPETTRLLFTAYADIRAVIDAINQGHVFRYLAKPWDPDELRAVVRQAVEHHDLIVEKNRLLAELQAANAKLIEANRLKGAFIEVASHELNTPVTVILGMIELWKMAPGDASPRPSGSGSTGSAPRRDGWPGPSSGCSSWSAAASSAARSSGRSVAIEPLLAPRRRRARPLSRAARAVRGRRGRARTWGRSRPIRTRSPTS